MKMKAKTTLVRAVLLIGSSYISVTVSIDLVSLKVVAGCFLRLSSWQMLLVPQSTPHCPC